MRACHRHGHGKRLIGSAAFFWASVPLPLPSNRRFIFTLPPFLFRSGFRQIQMFWAVTTTVLFALAAVALLTNRMALLATRLLTMMLVIFGLLVWVPLLLSDPHSHTNWSETVETFAIAGAAWILADLLGEYRLNDHRPR